MISVRNLHQQLSGSNILLFILCVLYSCSPSKRVVKDDVQIVKADNSKPKDDGKKVDTVEWKDVTDEKTPPITADNKKVELPDDLSKAEEARNKAVTYHLSMILPFSDNNQNTKFLQYYAGVKMAADVLELEGTKLIIDVLDAKDASVSSKINPATTHLIFGPNDEAGLKPIIEFGKSNKIPVVSPFFSMSSIENNPFYIQLKPSSRSHFIAMVKHIKREFKASEVALVGRDTKSDKNWFKYFQSIAKTEYGMDAELVFSEKFIVEDALVKQEDVFGKMVREGIKVFIFPNYSYKDESYLYAVLNKLNTDRLNKMVFVYGMPILKDSEKMTFEFFKNLNVRLPSAKFVDADNEEIKKFGRKFFENYGALPDADAYEGYDNMLFMGRALSKYGTNFQFRLKNENDYYLQTAFDVQPYKSDGSLNDVDYFENKHLDILEFNGFTFVRANN